MTKSGCLDKAIEITKEYAGSQAPNSTAIKNCLEEIYESLKKLSEDTDK